MHRLVREAARFGTMAEGVGPDWPAVIRRQHEIVAALRPTVAAVEKTGARVLLGSARFVDPHTVDVDRTRVAGEKVLIAAGSAPVIPEIPGRDLAITSDQLLFLPDFPPSLTFVGGGVIALEMSSAFADFGSRVTVLARDAEVLPNLDADVARYLRKSLESKGVIFRLNCRVTALDGRPGAVTAHFASAEIADRVSSTHVCMATGRRFHPRMLGAQALGLETAGLGLKVTPYLRSSVPHIYAAGDAAGNRQLTPTAAYEGRVAAVNALRGDTERADEAVIPQVIFTTPEAALVGLSYRQTQARGFRCGVARHDTRGASNGVATGEDGGYFKLVFDQHSQRLVGAQMISHAAAELIQFCALAIRTGATAGTVAAQLSVHPSHGERLIRAFGPDQREVCEID